MENKLRIVDGILIGCNNDMEKIEIPEGVTEIADMAFIYDMNIKSVVIPKTVKKIGYRAFCGCQSLTDVEIADGVKILGHYCFGGCTKLKTINLPKSVKSIGVGAFNECKILKTITIPDRITEIHEKTFNDCVKLECVNIPNNINTIGKSAFHNCSSLKNILIPDGVCEIHEDAFANSGLISVDFPKSLKRVGWYSFYNCYRLKEINFKYGVNLMICDGAFKNCPISKIKLPKSITYVGEDAFGFRKQTKSIKKGGKVTAYKAFHKHFVDMIDQKYDLYCLSRYYKEGETYVEPIAKLCNIGFHACLNPFDVFNYYNGSLENDMEIHEVTLEGCSGEMDNDSKICGTKITIGKKLSITDIAEIFNKQVENHFYNVKKITLKNKKL